MKVEIELTEKETETTVKIITNQITEEVSNIIKQIENINAEKIIAWKDKEAYILEFEQIERMYSSNGKVYIKTGKDEYTSKSKIYELEEKVKSKNFIRISNSEIINFKRVKSLDMSIIGTIAIRFESGDITYASRRNIKKIKEYLKM